MRVTYDPGSDAAYVYLVDHINPGEATRQEVAGRLILDFDEAGKLLGIEILQAARMLRAETIRSAQPRR
jgi:uncharacterized protein YuzE